MGCSRLTRVRYCQDYKNFSTIFERHRSNAAKRGYDAKWRKGRAQYLSQHPICVRCGGIATVVDKVVPHKEDANLFWTISNWQPLCKDM